MMYMLDTDTCSYIMRQHSQSVAETLEDKSNQGHRFCISVITYQELRFGAERVGSSKYHTRIDQICKRLDSVADWTVECADRFAVTQASLMAKCESIGFADAMIATHSLVLDSVLVTNNQRHFSRVKGLQLENWISHH